MKKIFFILFMCISYSCVALGSSIHEQNENDSLLQTKLTEYGSTYLFDFEAANQNIKTLKKKISQQKKVISNEKKVLNKLQKQLSKQQKEIKNAKKMIKKTNSVIMSL